MSDRPFKVLGLQQIAVGGTDKRALRKFWIDTMGLTPTGTYRSEKENVDEDIATTGVGAFKVEVDLMQPIDPDAKPKVHEPALNHVGLWIDNLAAPDALYDMSEWGIDLPFLGSDFNLLPLITVVLFYAQQKMFMPPPTTDEMAMQQKMMNFMMIFMGFLFYRVPAGLCVYFIASSAWGMSERKLLEFLPEKPVDPEKRIRHGCSGIIPSFASLHCLILCLDVGKGLIVRSKFPVTRFFLFSTSIVKFKLWQPFASSTRFGLLPRTIVRVRRIQSENCI